MQISYHYDNKMSIVLRKYERKTSEKQERKAAALRSCILLLAVLYVHRRVEGLPHGGGDVARPAVAVAKQARLFRQT